MYSLWVMYILYDEDILVRYGICGSQDYEFKVRSHSCSSYLLYLSLQVAIDLIEDKYDKSISLMMIYKTKFCCLF